MGLIQRIRRTPDRRRYSLDALINQVNYLGNTYPAGLQTTMTATGTEGPDNGFSAVVSGAYKRGGPIFACIAARAMLFSEARFLWQQFDDGRPGALFGTSSLSILETPWPNATTGELLWRAEQDVSLAGNFYLQHDRGRLWRLRPDWVTIILGSQTETDDPAEAIDVEVAGYLFKKPGTKTAPVALDPTQVAHWSPIPDPEANYRGHSWISSIMPDVEADRGATTHKTQFFQNAATPNLVVMPDATVSYEEFKEFKEDFVDQYSGAWNAYKTLFLGGGSKVETVGLDFKTMDFANIQGRGETRIAAAAMVPPIIAGFSEGLESATYSNYGQARRKFGDHYARPQWRSFAAAIQPLLTRPSGANRLWYDDRDIAFLREDQGDEADIRSKDAATIRKLVDGGYDPDAVVAFVDTGNVTALTGNHTGKLSVQLQEPDEPQPST